MTSFAFLCLTLFVGGEPVPVQEVKQFIASFPGQGDSGGESVRTFLNRQGGAPLVTEDGAVFFAQAKAGVAPGVVGDFNQWGAARGSEKVEPQAMTLIPGTDWYYLHVPLAADGRVEYRLVWDGQELPDPENPHRVWGWQGENSEVRLSGYQAPVELQWQEKPKEAGQVHKFEHESRICENRRDVFVYTPPGYDPEGAPYPLAVLGDGALYVYIVQTPALLDQLIDRGVIPPLVAVFIDPVKRGYEYRDEGRHAYGRMMNEELLPRIQQKYNVSSDPGQRAVVGGSRGALSAITLAVTYPRQFGFCGAFAPAVTPRKVDQLLPAEAGDVRFWVLVGTYDMHWREDGRRVVAQLQRKGISFDAVTVAEGHNIHTWKGRMRSMLTSWLTPGVEKAALTGPAK